MTIPQPTLRKNDDQPCYLYCFLGTVDRQWRRNEWMFVKVGVASNVHRRLRSYQTHCPVPFSAGFRVLLPTIKRARQLETTLLADDELSGWRGQGEWFVVMAGPNQHLIFIKHLLAAIYIDRFNDPSIHEARLEWVIVPDAERITEIPGADSQFLSGPESPSEVTGDDKLQRELSLRVRAEAQAEVIARLIYPELDDKTA